MKAWGYGRVSTGHQDNSEEYQREWLAKAIADSGIPLAEIVIDRAQSRRYTAFRNRTCGAYIVRNITPGDHIFIAKIDRMWGAVRDKEATQEWMEAMRIVLHIGADEVHDFGVARHNPSNVLMLNIRASISQYECDLRSARIREVIKLLQDRGEYIGPHKPYLKKKVRHEGKLILVPDEEEIALAREIWERKNIHGHTYLDITADLAAQGLRRDDRRGMRRNRLIDRFTVSRLANAYEKEYLNPCLETSAGRTAFSRPK